MDGNKNAGEGEKEILNFIEKKQIETAIRFKKPTAATGAIIMDK